MTREISFYRPFDTNDFVYERCFLCGNDFDSVERTDEHVFPKWPQHEFNLWNESLHLVNNSLIQYRFLTIPCCKICNGVHLSAMERKFIMLRDRKFVALDKDDEKIIFQWTAKILYGTLYKELSLLLDRRQSGGGAILSPEIITSYSTLHLFLQSIRIPTEFNAPKPWSVFVFNYDNDRFHYINDIERLSFSIKLGNVGVTITFEDNNIIEGFLEPLKKLEPIILNDIQFFEVTSKVFYAKRLALNAPYYSTAYHEPSNSMQVNSMGSIRGRDWSDEEYGASLEFMLRRAGFNIRNSIYENGSLTSFLVDENGEPYIKRILPGETD